MKVLFVCKANCGRSQMAEGFFNKFYPDYIGVSAGTNGHRHAGEYVPDDVYMLMMEEQIDISHQVTKQLTKDMVDSVDKVVVMCDEGEMPGYVADSGKVEYWPVEDPKGRKKGFMRQVRDSIRLKVRNMDLTR